jgi:hypothetical protein
MLFTTVCHFLMLRFLLQYHVFLLRMLDLGAVVIRLLLSRMIQSSSSSGSFR